MQVEVAKRLYSGPMNSRGERIYPEGALMPGSELSWEYWQRLGLTLGTEVFRYLAFPNDPGPSWTIKDFDFDKDPLRMRDMEALYSGANPDLSAFRNAGGKMIVWQGWAEIPGPPLVTIRYYEAVNKAMGGWAQTQSFVRLFMIPGLSHELERGKGPNISIPSLDLLTVLENWVEQGVAPEKLIGKVIHGKPASVGDTLAGTVIVVCAGWLCTGV